MVRNGDTLYFTEEDKANVVYREYSKLEIEKQKKRLKKKRNKKRFIYTVILCLLIMATRLEQLCYGASIALCFMIFLIMVEESMDRNKEKLVSRLYYIEILVDKKLPIESYYDYAGSDGLAIDFYPIEGHDTTSGYQSIFYIENWEEYSTAEIGSKIKISVESKGDV